MAANVVCFLGVDYFGMTYLSLLDKCWLKIYQGGLMIIEQGLSEKISGLVCRLMPFVVVLLYLVDGISKYSRSIGGGNISLYFRLFFVLIVSLYMLSVAHKVLNRLLLFISLILLLVVGYLVNGVDYNEGDIVTSFYVAARYLSFFVFFLSCSLFKAKNIIYALFCVFLINACLAWLGFLFDIELFRTYGHIRGIESDWVDLRFGFDGLILEQNNATFFYIFGLCISFYLWRNNIVSVPIVFFSIASCFLVGTKSLWGATILLSASFMIKNKMTRLLIMYFFVLLVCAFLILYGDHLSFDVINNLLSGRLLLLNDRFIPFFWDDVQIDTVLFGIQGGDYQHYLVEMEFIDIFSFFGLGGFVIILCMLYYGLFRLGCVLFNYNFVMSIVLLVSAFSGHLFYDPVASFYFCFFVMACYELNDLNVAINTGELQDNSRYIVYSE